jgi:hypothetical protein
MSSAVQAQPKRVHCASCSRQKGHGSAASAATEGGTQRWRSSARGSSSHCPRVSPCLVPCLVLLSFLFLFLFLGAVSSLPPVLRRFAQKAAALVCLWGALCPVQSPLVCASHFQPLCVRAPDGGRRRCLVHSAGRRGRPPAVRAHCGAAQITAHNEWTAACDNVWLLLGHLCCVRLLEVVGVPS